MPKQWLPSNGLQGTENGMDDAPIRAIVAQIEQGWNAGDGSAFAAPFADDADYVVVNGMHMQGRAAIAAGHEQLFVTIYRGSHNEGTVQNVRFLRDDVALAHVAWHLRFVAGGEPREARAMNTMVMLRGEEGWEVAAFHNTPVLPPQGAV